MRGFLILLALIWLEVFGMWCATAWLVTELWTASAASIRSAVALIVLAGVLTTWLTATAVATVRRVRWARGSAITWQVLQAAIAFGALQGEASNVTIALALLVPAIVVVLLMLSRGIRAEFGIESDENS